MVDVKKKKNGCDDGVKRSCEMDKDMEAIDRIMKEDLIDKDGGMARGGAEDLIGKDGNPSLLEFLVLLASLPEDRFVEIIEECKACVGADGREALEQIKKRVVGMTKRKEPTLASFDVQ